MSTLEERFEAGHTTGCWVWKKSTSRHDYGFIREAGQTLKAHRVAWLIHRGPIPAGLHVLHTCDVPACVNPNHLFLGTPKDNARDKSDKGRASRIGPWKVPAAVTREMRRLYADGVTLRAIGRQFHVCHGTVTRHLGLKGGVR